MRTAFATLLALGSCLAASYYSQGQTSPIARAKATPDTIVSHGTAYDIPLGPTSNQRPVQANIVFQEPTLYAVTLPVQRDRDATILLDVNVNPKAHSTQRIEALFAPVNNAVTYRQIGKGISRYDASTGRYYFSTVYQTIRKLPNGYTNNGPGRVITGWVKPGTSQAAIADEAIPN